jgi:isochorismate synthase
VSAVTSGAVASDPALKAPRPPLTSDDVSAFVRDALAGRRREPGPIAVTVRAPAAPIETPLRALRKGPTVIFAPPQGPAIACWGAARLVRVQGADRLTHAREAATALLSGIRPLAQPDALVLPPRVLFGFAFAPGSAGAPPWDSFGDGVLLLPRWTYAVEGARASLTLVATDPLDERLAFAELEASIDALARRPRDRRPPPPVVRVDDLDRARWTGAVEDIRAAIARGEARKIVAARRAVVTTTTDLDPIDVLERLGDTRAPWTRFAFRLGRATLVGATPEHLLTLRGTRVTTEALAGSIAAGTPGAAEALLASDKDREEHAFVVGHVVERLTPLAARIAHPQLPEIRRLPTVLHLCTPIEAELARPTHPLDLVAALHPTPAVGGTPVERAAAWIAAREPAQRGWYGGPFGWIDARGDAEVMVALRCAVIQGARAWLWAGSGIVAGSDPDREWDETSLKLGSMLSALGVSP